MRKSKYNLEGEKAVKYNSYNERFIRWQDKSITLLTFSINLIFTISLTLLAIIIGKNETNLEENISPFGSCQLSTILICLIGISSLFGLLALYCRLYNSKFTAKLVRKRQFLFMKRIQVKELASISESQLKKDIDSLKCCTKHLGDVTWIFFNR